MNRFIKCELCDTEISEETCVFAMLRRTSDGEEHCFCCEQHAEEFEQKHGDKSEKTGK
jgi:hypothetical protein